MNIGIDARFVGPQGTGIGKYTEKLIVNLANLDKVNNYNIFLKEENLTFLTLPKNFKKIKANVHWYSLEEQIKMPDIYKRAKLDLLHIPHFNVPFFYNRPYVVTIHDLIHHHFSETSATTKGIVSFKTKRLAYKIIVANAIKKSKKIIVPSKHVKAEALKYYKVHSGKIKVTYEAAEEEYFNKIPNSKFQIPNSLLYVGNVYPHKNLSNLLDAVKILKNTKKKIKLTIVCARDVFYQRLKEQIHLRNLNAHVQIKGYLNTKELVSLFNTTKAYVFPTLSEGFGIPGLNAMAAKTPLICSDIPPLREIYGEAALFFDPKSPTDIAEKIEIILKDTKTRRDLVEIGEAQVKKYSWQQMAEETLQIYKSCI